jgi:pimeloyl-ACP methyl ester carboxylesterase
MRAAVENRRSVYRSRAGEGAVRGWCERRLDRWTVPHDRVEIDTTLGSTHLVIAGNDHEATLLYLPGTNFNAATSLPVAGELAAGARVVIADLPGQPGLSSGQRPTGPRVAAYGSWAGEVIENVRRSVGADSLLLVGHSLGAAVALAAPSPGVAALVLLNPAGCVRVRVSPSILMSTLSWLLRPSGKTSAALLRQMLSAPHQPRSDLVEWMALVARYTKPAGAPGPLDPGVPARWHGTGRLVLSGQHDCFLPPARLSRAVETSLGVPLGLLPALGHLSVEEDPVGLSRLILETLQDSRPAVGERTRESSR